MRNSIFRNHHFYYKTKWIHGKVVYKNLISTTTESLSKLTVKYPAFRKESAFTYENEYRFVVELVEPTTSHGFAFVLGELYALPFKVLINPLLNNDQYSSLKEELINNNYGKYFEESALAKWLKPELW
jgi:hypothetical protein